MSELETLNSPQLADPFGPYSHGVRVGDLLFCAGQLPIRADAQIVSANPTEQARQCLQNLAEICAEAGTSLDRAVRLGVFLTDGTTFDGINSVYAAFLPHRPARSTVEVYSLPFGAAVEIDAIIRCA